MRSGLAVRQRLQALGVELREARQRHPYTLAAVLSVFFIAGILPLLCGLWLVVVLRSGLPDREAVRRIRATKAMLITPGDEDCRSAGSFFKNPVLAAEQYQQLTERARAKGLQIPNYPALDAQQKVSAAWLVEHSGFSKGYRSGRVGISRKHALAIVNRGEATAADILGLKEHIQQRVGEIWGIELEAEPVLVGL